MGAGGGKETGNLLLWVTLGKPLPLSRRARVGFLEKVRCLVGRMQAVGVLQASQLTVIHSQVWGTQDILSDPLNFNILYFLSRIWC